MPNRPRPSTSAAAHQAFKYAQATVVGKLMLSVQHRFDGLAQIAAEVRAT